MKRENGKMLTSDEIIFIKANVAQKMQLNLREVEICILISKLKQKSDWITFSSASDIATVLYEIKEDVQEVYRNLSKNEHGGDLV